MNRLPRTQFGNPILKTKAKKVSTNEIRKPSFQKLVKQMSHTVKDIGVGLAAPQIGKSLQLAVIRIKQNKIRPHISPLSSTVIINPKITKKSKEETSDWEGCLSLSQVRGLVPRHKSITVKYLDEYGQKQRKQFTDFQARVFQHEIDHLNGILYVDRMRSTKTLMTEQEFRKRILKRGLKSK